ncbi:MAG: hypothetical protein JST39_19315, partial [Bacteroidetes bacterium]|nr:hypothetical protein [Bacteroidota bacterium]
MKTTISFLSPPAKYLFACWLIATLSAQQLSAQTLSMNQWVWVNGDSAINKPGNYGTRGVAAATNKPGARASYVSWVDASGNFWLFGGAGYGAPSGGFGQLNDLWMYNRTTYQWIWISGDSMPNRNGMYGTKGTTAATNMPGGRTVCSHWLDASGNVWLYGGGGLAHSGGYGYLSDLWKYVPSTNQWTWINGDSSSNQHAVYGTKGSPAAANKPGSGQHDNSWIDASGNLWLFGGAAYAASGLAGNTNDLWKYSVSTNKWTWIAGDSVIQKYGVYGTKGTGASANTPGARVAATCWTDNSHNLWLFGGAGMPASGSSGYMNDTWMFNTSTNKWIWITGDSVINQNGSYGTKTIAAASNRPGSRYCSLTWIDASNNVWMFGGQGYGATGGTGMLNDMWQFNIMTNQWVWMRGDSIINQYGIYGVKGSTASPNKPGARSIARGWLDANGNPWVFGGFGYAASGTNAYLNDLWGYQASNSSFVMVLLPEQLLQFNAVPAGQGVAVNWKTAPLPDAVVFHVQRSSDAGHWQTIGSLRAQTGCNAACSYKFTDLHSVAGISYYRLELAES